MRYKADETKDSIFLARMPSVDSATDCAIWQGNINTEGYGRFSWQGKWVLAHRYAWERKNGLVPDRLGILHNCDVPLCVNDLHLYAGTALDNARDKKERGRGADVRGVKNPRAILRDEDIVELRLLSRYGSSAKELSQRYGICTTAVHRAARGLSWTETAASLREELTGHGEGNPMARLTNEKVRAIRRGYAAGRLQKDLAVEFGVTDSNISMVVHRLTWKNVD